MLINLLKSHRYFWWILFGGMVLTFNAGYLNTVALESHIAMPVTHMTGNVSNIAKGLITDSLMRALSYVSLVVAFVLGAMVSGYLIIQPKLSLDSSYSKLLFLQSFFLFLACLLLKATPSGWMNISGDCIAFAAGMQNALVTKFTSALIRTTHLTGILTDLGIELGHWLRHWLKEGPVQVWKIQLFLLSVLSYLLGSFAGGYAYTFFSAMALLGPACFTLILALSYPVLLLFKANRRKA